MEQDAPFLPELPEGDVLLMAQQQPDFDAKPSTTTEPSFWWNPPVGPDGFIVVNEADLWTSFYGNVLGAKCWLEKYLEHMENIKAATLSASAPPGKVQAIGAAQTPLSQGQQATPGCHSPPKSATPPIDIDRERNRMKISAAFALPNLYKMDEILDVIEMLPQRSEPTVSLAPALATITFSISALVAPNDFLANVSMAGAANAAFYLLNRPLWRWFKRYNLACIHQEVRDLIRAFKEERIGEKNGNDLDSWHLRARRYIRLM
ncbi:hypothetical protein ACHAPT_012749 [Fusarium lateritium]